MHVTTAVTAPDEWRDGAAGNAAIDPEWWQAFNGPALTALIERALARNTDVLAAAARVQQAQASIRLARSAMLPTLDAVGGGQHGRDLGAVGATTSTVLQPELQLNWQVDLFGRLSRLTDAARLRYVASQADRDAIALSVAAQVAQVYIGLLALDAQLVVSQETVTSRAEAFRRPRTKRGSDIPPSSSSRRPSPNTSSAQAHRRCTTRRSPSIGRECDA
jgi:multidrug efflux system outer membrane protein